MLEDGTRAPRVPERVGPVLCVSPGLPWTGTRVQVAPLLATPEPRAGAARAPGPAASAPVAERSSCLCSAFDLVNIHLFHDASNLVAWETSPSVYAGIRHKALGYVLDR